MIETPSRHVRVSHHEERTGITKKCYILGDAIGAMCETTGACESPESITEEELENEKDKEKSPTMIEAADRKRTNYSSLS